MNYKKNIELKEIKEEFEKFKTRYIKLKNIVKERNSNYIHIGKNVEEHICFEVKDYQMKKWETNFL